MSNDIELPDTNPYKHLSEDEYISVQIKYIADLCCRCACATLTNNTLEVQKMTENNWQKYIPVVKEMLHGIDLLDIEKSGGRLQ